MDKRLLELELGIRLGRDNPNKRRKNPFGDEYNDKYKIEEQMKKDFLERILRDSEERTE